MNRNILITGVSRGVGLQICTTLLESGYTVYGISRSINENLENLKNKFDGNFFHIEYDLSDTEDIKNRIFKEWIGFDTPIYGFVNNAASAYDDLVTNLNTGKLETMFSVNVFSPMVIVKYVIRHMLLHKIKGSLVHISSISAHTGYKGLAMYASTKGAIEAFSKNTAREWGKLDIRSNCIVAGFMETDMSSSLTEEQRDKIYNRTALRKPTNLESVAHTVKFLLSDASQSVTGQNIFVDSGTI